MCSSRILVESMAKDHLSASTSSSSAVSCLRLRFTSSWVNSSVGCHVQVWQQLLKAYQPKHPVSIIIDSATYVQAQNQFAHYAPFCQCMVIIRKTRFQHITYAIHNIIIHSCTGLAQDQHTRLSFVRHIYMSVRCTVLTPPWAEELLPACCYAPATFSQTSMWTWHMIVLSPSPAYN